MFRPPRRGAAFLARWCARFRGVAWSSPSCASVPDGLRRAAGEELSGRGPWPTAGRSNRDRCRLAGSARCRPSAGRVAWPRSICPTRTGHRSARWWPRTRTSSARLHRARMKLRLPRTRESLLPFVDYMTQLGGPSPWRFRFDRHARLTVKCIAAIRSPIAGIVVIAPSTTRLLHSWPGPAPRTGPTTPTDRRRGANRQGHRR